MPVDYRATIRQLEHILEDALQRQGRVIISSREVAAIKDSIAVLERQEEGVEDICPACDADEHDRCHHSWVIRHHCACPKCATRREHMRFDPIVIRGLKWDL